MPDPDPLDLDALRAEARRVGFEWVGVAPVEPEGGGWFAPHAARYEAWLRAGRHADMGYLVEGADARVHPGGLLPGVRSAVVLWLPHRCPPPPRPPGARGRVAAYAAGRDYHNVARKALRKLRKWVLRHAPGAGTYLSVDTGPVLERAFGSRAGVGWIGRNTLLIHPRLGSFGSLAVLLLDLPLRAPPAAHPDRCGTCTACLQACPTGALDAEGLDARKCISYWTIERAGSIPPAIRPRLGQWVFGCDLCQDACPWNHDAPTADPAVWRPVAARAWPDLISWVRDGDAAVEAQIQGSPLRRAGATSLRRNALIALANGRHRGALPVIEAAAIEDPDPVVRETAAWAAARLRPSAPDCAARPHGVPPEGWTRRGSMSGALNLDVVGRELGPATFDYDWKTCALYALGVGAGTDELPYLWEQAAPFRVFPSFAVLPSFPVVIDALGKIEADWRTLVHGAQTLSLHAPIPKQAQLITEGRVSEVLDQGKGAVVFIDTETRAEGELLFETRWSIYCRGQGGFGGARGEKPSLPEAAPGAAPAFDWSAQTLPNQAALYRLSGDLNPLHIDPALATKAGFERPILHGLCTYGFAVRAVVAELCGGNPGKLARFSARFSETVYPGDALRVRAIPASQAGTYLLEALVEDRTVLSHGVVELR